jgi:multidrug efflux system membrane fusion protein
MFAYVVKADQTVDARPIETAEEAQGMTVIVGGIQAGERVVTTNQYRLQPGASVHLNASTNAAAPAAVAQPAGKMPGS